MITVRWDNGENMCSAWFWADIDGKEKAQDLIIDLQRQGITPTVKRVDGKQPPCSEKQ